MAHADPVTPEMRLDVFMRDRGCVAPVVDPAEAGKCKGRLTLEHVKRHPMMGKRSPSIRRDMVVLCALHHFGEDDKEGRIWSSMTISRCRLIDYLDQLEPESTE